LEPVLNSRRPSNQIGRTEDPSAPIVNDQGDIEHVVEAIHGKRLHYGKLKYLVKWKGYADHESTWEPLNHLTNALDAVKEFESYNSAAMIAMLQLIPEIVCMDCD